MGLYKGNYKGEKKGVPLDPNHFNPMPNTEKACVLLKQTCSAAMHNPLKIFITIELEWFFMKCRKGLKACS